MNEIFRRTPEAAAEPKRSAPRRLVDITLGSGVERIVDISATGARVEIPAEAGKATLFRIDIKEMGGGAWSPVLAKKAWEAPAGEHGVRVGLCFLQASPDLRRFLDSVASPAEADAPPAIEARGFSVAPMEDVTLVFHRLRFDDRKLEVLSKCGYHVHYVRSAEQVARVPETARGVRVAIVDVSSGGNGPERIRRAIDQMAGTGFPPLMVAASTHGAWEDACRSSGSTRRTCGPRGRSARS